MVEPAPENAWVIGREVLYRNYLGLVVGKKPPASSMIVCRKHKCPRKYQVAKPGDKGKKTELNRKPKAKEYAGQKHSGAQRGRGEKKPAESENKIKAGLHGDFVCESLVSEIDEVKLLGSAVK